jgi:hypothetical protein
MTVLVIHPTTAPAIDTITPPAATCISMVAWPGSDLDLVLRAECGLSLALVNGQYVHTDKCRDCWDTTDGVSTLWSPEAAALYVLVLAAAILEARPGTYLAGLAIAAPFVDESCPAVDRHAGGCDGAQSAGCDHPHCHEDARVDVPPCTRGHSACCGCCNEEE